MYTLYNKTVGYCPLKNATMIVIIGMPGHSFDYKECQIEKPWLSMDHGK
jgi:hypothetical protein